uniref:Uncharacterized protein n=1 Tax=Medicago truncatula TaxID=3880 RepID=B7FIM4_MEDTR|nr:unknown [Medicago truncatula]
MLSASLLQPESMEAASMEAAEAPIPSESLMDQISKYKTMMIAAYKRKPIPYWILLVLGIIAMVVAFPASSILSRVYYANGGQSKWIISWVAVVGWPLIALILLPTYFVTKTVPTPLSLILFLSYVVLGFLSAADNLMVSLFAFLFTTVGTFVSGDFQRMTTEATSFKGGRSAYYLVLIWSAVTFQLGVLGATAVIFLASTVLAGVLNAVRTPITSIAAVILLHDPMSGFKILSLVITFWGFGSYIYGSSMDDKQS